MPSLSSNRFKPGLASLRLAPFTLFLAGVFPTLALAQAPVQKTFASAELASAALVAAVASQDEPALLALLGPEGKLIVSSGDDTEDANNRAEFLKQYEQQHRLVREPDGRTTLCIGTRLWPTPIPLLEQGSQWRFDTEAGKQEILYRRIGQNEVATLAVCQELVAAQKEYFSATGHAYAQKLFSAPGQHDGLYWQAAVGEPASPMGPLVASAVAMGYPGQPAVAPTPYQGYLYRMLTQGQHGSGPVKSYLVKGRMTRGFALVAFPAAYRSSGVMTFIVNQDGKVYERDLGPQTAILAQELQAFHPTGRWHLAEVQPHAGPEEPAY